MIEICSIDNNVKALKNDMSLGVCAGTVFAFAKKALLHREFLSKIFDLVHDERIENHIYLIS